MTITQIIIGAVLAVFSVLLISNYRRMKNLGSEPDSEKVKHLNSDNFTQFISKGVSLVDFWAGWCRPCKVLAPIINDIAEKESDIVKVGKVDVDKEQNLAQKYQIRSIPTMIIFKDGKEVKRLVGIKSRKQILREIERVI